MHLPGRLRERAVLRRASARTHEFLLAQATPADQQRSVVVGEDPLRILLVGAGVAVGYGVDRSEQALGGQIARFLASRTARGVIVESRVRPNLLLHDTVDLLGAAGAHTFDAVVWAPTFREMFRPRSRRGWARTLDRIVAHLRSTGTPETGVVLLGLPEVEVRTVPGQVAMRRLRIANEGIALAAARGAAGFVPVPAIGPVDPARPICDAEYYRRCAQAVGPALLEAIDRGSPLIVPGAPPVGPRERAGAVLDALAMVGRRWMQQAQTRPELLPFPRDVPRCSVAGIDPDRVLLLGGGPVIGFGVLTHDLALPGHLARALAARTGRGAAVDLEVDVDFATGRPLLGIDGLKRYDAVVLAVGGAEALAIQHEDRWRAGLGKLVEEIRAATSVGTQLIVLPIAPLRRGSSHLGSARRLADIHAEHLDDVVERVCRSTVGLGRVPPLEGDTPPSTSREYRALAERITAVLADELDLLATSIDPDSARSYRNRREPEERRQAALDRSGLADAVPSEELERLVRHARDLFGAAGASVTLLDRDRQRRIAALGIPSVDAARRAAPCDRTIGQSRVLTMVSRDGTEVAPGGWRWYAGHPLESPDGYRIGTLSIVDHRARELSEAEGVALADLAGRVQNELWKGIEPARFSLRGRQLATAR